MKHLKETVQTKEKEHFVHETHLQSEASEDSDEGSWTETFIY